ncbi:MAG: hypothetical protein LAO30_08690 [Acidobacteriia bacterium]|nr:hypothetical protein [Terriglobia bacterium]
MFVIFEGPWAIVQDPKDTNNILAVAPKTKSHRPLAVSPASVALEAGVYDFAVPAHGAPASLNPDASFLRATVDPKNVQRILDNRLERYVIRLPKPEGYVAGGRHRSRVGNSYPPDPSTEQNYATSISLRYNVSSLTGFSLAGTKDAGGAFNPLLLQLDTPIVRFTIDPAQDYNDDACNTHSRQAFSDLVRLLGLALYVDFPDNPSDCHKRDPQLVRSEKAQSLHALAVQQIAGVAKLQTGAVAGGILAAYFDLAARKIADGLALATYLFHADGAACTAPIIVGNGC